MKIRIISLHNTYTSKFRESYKDLIDHVFTVIKSKALVNTWYHVKDKNDKNHWINEKDTEVISYE